MKYEIRSIGLWSFVKLSFFLNLALGFVFGILYALLLGFVMTVSSRFPMFEQTERSLEGMSLGIMLIILPIMMAFFMAVFNTVIGSIGVMLYNFSARVLGGLEMTLQETALANQPPAGLSPVYAGAASASPPPPPLYGASPPNPGADTLPTPKPEPPSSQYE